MKKDKREKGIEKFFFIFLSLTVLAFSLIIGCSNPANDDAMPGLQADAPGGKGYFSLTVEGAGQAKTVLPATVSFSSYNLYFKPAPTSVVTPVAITSTANPVLVDPGTYYLDVEGLVSGAVVAIGSLAGTVTINPGANASASVTLELITDGVNNGTFSWAISFTTPASITAADMTITPRSAGTPVNIDLTVPANLIDSMSLKSGYYNVLFTVESDDNNDIEWREILHVYQNLVSTLTKNFTDDYFNNNVYNVTWVYNDAAISTETTNSVIHGDAVTYPSPPPTRSGYTLDDWYTDDGTFANAWVSTDHPVKDITLYARWKSTVTYNANGGGSDTTADTYGGFTMANVTVPVQGSLALTGFTFDGWNEQANGGGTNYAAGATYTPAGITTLYARWKCTISFDANGATGSVASMDAYAGGSITLPGQGSLVYSTLTMTGWNTLANGTGSDYAAGASFSTPSTGDATLYAKWPITSLSMSITDSTDSLSPINVTSPTVRDERIATFTVTVGGFANSGEQTGIGLNISTVSSGLTIDPSDVSASTTTSKVFTVKVTYDGTTAFTDNEETITITGLSGLGASFSYTGGSKTTTISIRDGLVAYTGAAGTYDRRIKVTQDNIQHFNVYAGTTAGLSKHYILTEDVTLPAGPDNWTPIGSYTSSTVNDPFTGTFDGGNHSIADIAIDFIDSYVGMFTYAVGAEIKNLNLVDYDLQAAASMFAFSSLAGIIENTTIQNCDAGVTFDITNGNGAGGLVYWARGNSIIEDCHVYLNGDMAIYAGQAVGGIVGLIGNSSGGAIVRNCGVTGTGTIRIITGQGLDRVGGVVGRIDPSPSSTVENCYSTVAVSSRSYAGGVVGHNSTGGTVKNCYSTGNVTKLNLAGEGRTGGVVGWNEGGAVLNCYSTGSLNDQYSSGNELTIGGVVGLNDAGGTVEYCYATGNITHVWSNVGRIGGVAGKNIATGSVGHCVALAQTITIGSTSNSYTGRVVGENFGTLSNNYANNGMTATFGFQGTNAPTDLGGANFVDWSSIWGTLPTTKPSSDATPWWLDGGVGNPKLWFED